MCSSIHFLNLCTAAKLIAACTSAICRPKLVFPCAVKFMYLRATTCRLPWCQEMVLLEATGEPTGFKCKIVEPSRKHWIQQFVAWPYFHDSCLLSIQKKLLLEATERFPGLQCKIGETSRTRLILHIVATQPRRCACKHTRTCAPELLYAYQKAPFRILLEGMTVS